MKIVQLQLISVFFTIILVSGCGSIQNLNTSTKPAVTQSLATTSKMAAIQEKNVPELKRGQSVYIKNYYSRPEIVTLGNASSSMIAGAVEVGTDGYRADLEQFTRTAIISLSKALKFRDIEFAKTGPKQVILRVHSARYKQGAFSADIGVSVTAELGNSKSITASSTRSFSANTSATASFTVSDSIREILNHPDFIQYINQ